MRRGATCLVGYWLIGFSSSTLICTGLNLEEEEEEEEEGRSREEREEAGRRREGRAEGMKEGRYIGGRLMSQGNTERHGLIEKLMVNQADGHVRDGPETEGRRGSGVRLGAMGEGGDGGRGGDGGGREGEAEWELQRDGRNGVRAPEVAFGEAGRSCAGTQRERKRLITGRWEKLALDGRASRGRPTDNCNVPINCKGDGCD